MTANKKDKKREKIEYETGLSVGRGSQRVFLLYGDPHITNTHIYVNSQSLSHANKNYHLAADSLSPEITTQHYNLDATLHLSDSSLLQLG